jgi:gamma-glutamylcyclotransferase (GGCT)/AIG2-like uncharacterized protein YtfP
MRLGAAIFAYGTLMSGEFNHEWALRPDAIEQARVQGKLYHMGYCPALVARGVGVASAKREDDVVRSGVRACPPEHAHVKGELFWYADDERAQFALRSMDRLEGYSPEFPSSSATRESCFLCRCQTVRGCWPGPTYGSPMKSTPRSI